MVVVGVSPMHPSLLEATQLHKMKRDAVQRDKSKSLGVPSSRSHQLMCKEVDNDLDFAIAW